MQSASPVHSDVALLSVQASGTFHAATGTDSAEFKQAIKHRAIISDVVLGLLSTKVVHVLGSNSLQEVDVLVRVELGHLKAGCGLSTLGIISDTIP